MGNTTENTEVTEEHEKDSKHLMKQTTEEHRITPKAFMG